MDQVVADSGAAWLLLRAATRVSFGSRSPASRVGSPGGLQPIRLVRARSLLPEFALIHGSGEKIRISIRSVNPDAEMIVN